MKKLSLLLILLLCGAPCLARKPVSKPSEALVEVTWDAIPSADVSEYLLQWGERSGQYVGSRYVQGTAAKLSLKKGRTWYFVCRGVHATGVAGDPSKEVKRKL